MFTGIIQAVGHIVARQAQGAGARLVIDAGSLDLTDVALGDSIAVAGVCLTVVAREGRQWCADVSAETLARTTLGALAPAARVNLEKALRLSDRLGGHLVSGHVDGIGEVVAIEPEAGGAQRWTLRAPAALMRYIAVKGSICVDGTSLTVNTLAGDCFGVSLIPHTLLATSLGGARPGSAVNLEVDLMARYAERLAQGTDAAT
ncbi:MAG: riboflavin synthase [Dokdonella sp.]|uniref:riboflavin synthase n=1 Tax=Dokdonella sp. TaxID=2291710 RepID=UPI0025B9E59B|nr:riboflavin synthase [Dokdonella sp.]MBX3701125.1 riboflavin synthase [Dokdonella sp.]MCW5579388.1 riboflavin synthase [Dokdonella sp.]